MPPFGSFVSISALGIEFPGSLFSFWRRLLRESKTGQNYISSARGTGAFIWGGSGGWVILLGLGIVPLVRRSSSGGISFGGCFPRSAARAVVRGRRPFMETFVLLLNYPFPENSVSSSISLIFSLASSALSVARSALSLWLMDLYLRSTLS